MERRHRSARIALVALLTVVGLHLGAVTLTALPPNPVSAGARQFSAYLTPFFGQNWKLFAPSPISVDQEFWARAEYRNQRGQTQVTEWFSWTDVELEGVRGRLVGQRAAHITTKFIPGLRTRFLNMSYEQRLLAVNDRRTAMEGYSELRVALHEETGSSVWADAWLRYEYAAVRLATVVMNTVYPDRDLVAVQYRTSRQQVAPFGARDLPEPQREAVRPEPEYRSSGWRLPIGGSARQQAVVADFLRRHS